MRAGRVPIVLLLPIAGCFQPAPVAEERPTEFADAEKAYLGAEYPKARLLYERFRAAHPGSAYVAQALYFEGRCFLLEGKPILARQRLEGSRAATTDATLKGQSALAIGDAYFAEDLYAEAEGAYLSARGSGGVPPDEVLYKSALAARRLGHWDEAALRFREIAEHFPAGSRAADAKRQLDQRDRFFAIQAGVFEVKAHAESRAAEIRKAGIESRVQPVGEPAKQSWRVSVGSFPDYAAAKSEMSTLKTNGVVPDAMIIP